MSKKVFRHLRGEINGFYLSNLHNSLNELIKEDTDFLRDLKNMVFKNTEDTVNIEYPISEKDLKGIGVIAGGFLPRIGADSFNGSLRFTNSYVVNGTEYSERGLFDTEEESFNFVRTDEQSYATDINTLATNKERSSIAGDNNTVIGYLPSGVDIIKDDGTIDLTKILSEPPEDSPYYEFYGTEFLYLSEGNTVYAQMSRTLYLELIKSLQWIRYNGSSLSSMCKIINILCPEFLKIESIDWSNGHYGVVSCSIDEEYVLELKQARVATLLYFMQIKFPQFIFIEQ